MDESFCCTIFAIIAPLSFKQDRRGGRNKLPELRHTSTQSTINRLLFPIQNIILPTEQQWQRAAQGDDGLKYPWGNEWDGSRCNNSDGMEWDDIMKKDITTTAVTQYEGKGDSPFGVVDMSGNIWEWTLSAYKIASEDMYSANTRVLRGGSWFNNNDDNFRAASRGDWDPHDWYYAWGFRVARS